MGKIALIALAILSPLAFGAGSQTILLKDGTQFRGTFVSGTATAIVFRDDNGDRHRFDVNEIQSLNFSDTGYTNSGSNNNRDRYNTNSNNNGYNNNNSSNVNGMWQDSNGSWHDSTGRVLTDRERRDRLNDPNYNNNPNNNNNNANVNGMWQDSNGSWHDSTGRVLTDRERRERLNNPNYNNPSSNNNNYSNNSTYSNNSGYQTLPTGTEVGVRTNETIDTTNATEGRTYSASIYRDVMDSSGSVVIPKGSDAQLVVRDVNRNGNLVLDLQSVTLNGSRYLVSSQDLTQSGGRQGIGANKRTAEIVGGGTALGTLLGAIGGGGKGALIGALAGAAAGAGVEVLTKGSRVKVPAETVLNFRLDQPVQLNPAR